MRVLVIILVMSIGHCVCSPDPKSLVETDVEKGGLTSGEVTNNKPDGQQSTTSVDAKNIDTKNIEKEKSPLSATTTATTATTATTSSSSHAYVTLVSSDDADYILGAAVLGRSISETSIPHHPADLVCLLSQDQTYRQESIDMLERSGWTVKKVSKVETPFPDKCDRFCDTYQKLRVWELAYEKVVYLDADMLVLKDISSLFATPLGPSPSIAAAPHCGDRHNTINSGMFVLEPSGDTFRDMMSKKGSVEQRVIQHDSAAEYADQTFIHGYFRPCFLDESCDDSHLKELPTKYNSMIHNKYCRADAKDANVWHFTAQTKPWNNEYLTAKPEASYYVDVWRQKRREYGLADANTQYQ